MTSYNVYVLQYYCRLHKNQNFSIQLSALNSLKFIVFQQFIG